MFVFVAAAKIATSTVICDLSTQTLDTLNFFSQLHTVSFAILFGLVATLIAIVIYK